MIYFARNFQATEREEEVGRMKKKKTRKPYVAGGVAAGIIAAAYASFLPLNKPIHFVILAGLCALVGWVVYTMATGLDTSQKAPPQRPAQQTGSPTVDQMVAQGMEMLDQIREENAGIADPELTRKIDSLEDISRRIFTTVADKPDKAPQIRRFMSYYLPTVLKMLTNYRKLDERGVTGENADRTKATVENAMDVVLEAFRKQHDQLYQAEALDVGAEVQVLETMLKQDGLMEAPMQAAAQTMPK